MNPEQLDTRPPSVKIAAVNARFMRLISMRDTRPLVAVWAIISLIGLGVTMAGAWSSILSGGPPLHELLDPEISPQHGPSAPGSGWLGLLTVALVWLIATLYPVALGFVREFELSPTPPSLRDVRATLFSRLIPTAVTTAVTMFLTVLCFTCCLPGSVLLFFFYLAPYLAATCGDSIRTAFSESSRMAWRHALVSILVLSLSLGCLVGFVILRTILVVVFQSAMGAPGEVLGFVGAWAAAVVVGYFVWLYIAAALAEILEAAP